MSSDLGTVDLQTGSTETDVSSSGAWSESFVKRPETPWLVGLMLAGGMCLAVAAPPATPVQDHWFFEGRRRNASTVMLVSERVFGRPITMQRAREIALQLMHEIEQERLRVAEIQATRVIDLEDFS